MVALRRTVLVWTMLVGLLSWAVAQTPQAEVPAVLEPLAAIQEAERLLGEAEFGSALIRTRTAIAALQTPPGTPRPQGESRAQLARAYDVEAQCLFNLNRHSEMREAMERLLALVPNYQIDRSVAGPPLVDELERRRKATVGTIAVQCSPIACDSVHVDDELQAPNAEGRFLVPAGDRRVRVGRRNFQTVDLPAVRVMPGEVSTVTATIQQVSRDVLLVTEPPGVSIVVDGRELGVTERGDVAVSKPFVIPELAPGDHVLVLTAPCRRRLEQSLDLFLDAQDPGQLDLGVLKLAESRAALELKPSTTTGELFIDGKPGVVGSNSICPGTRDVSWLVAGRRVWFSATDVREGESLALELQPRPTMLLVAPSKVGGFPGEAWNVLMASADAMELRGQLTRLLPRGNQLPLYPSWLRGADTTLADRLRVAAPEADLAALVISELDPIQPSTGIVLVDVRRGVWEATAWRDADLDKSGLTAALNEAWQLTEPLLGFDLIDSGGMAVVGGVFEGSPAVPAKISDGMTLVSVDGEPPSTDFLRNRASARGAGPLRLVFTNGPHRLETQLTPVEAITVPAPASLPARPLLPQLARCEVWRVAGEPLQTMACAVHSGMILLTLGRDDEAATTLDRAAIDAAADPAGDARATVAFELERLLRRLGRPDYADEVHRRWVGLPLARYGGRLGPPLRHATLTPPAQRR